MTIRRFQAPPRLLDEGFAANRRLQFFLMQRLVRQTSQNATVVVVKSTSENHSSICNGCLSHPKRLRLLLSKSPSVSHTKIRIHTKRSVAISSSEKPWIGLKSITTTRFVPALDPSWRISRGQLPISDLSMVVGRRFYIMPSCKFVF